MKSARRGIRFCRCRENFKSFEMRRRPGGRRFCVLAKPRIKNAPNCGSKSRQIAEFYIFWAPWCQKMTKRRPFYAQVRGRELINNPQTEFKSFAKNGVVYLYTVTKGTCSPDRPPEGGTKKRRERQMVKIIVAIIIVVAAIAAVVVKKKNQ